MTRVVGPLIFRGLAPGQHEETSQLQRVIEIYNHFAVIIRRQYRRLKIVSHEMPYDFSYRYVKGRNRGYEGG